MQFPKQALDQRLKNTQQKILENKLDALLISSHQNRHYLTGWRGDEESGYLLITDKKAFIITDSRYSEEASAEVPHFDLKEYGKDDKFWKNIFSGENLKKVGFEVKNLSVFDLKKLRKQTKAKFVETSDFIERLREEKEHEEISFLKKAAAICDKTFLFILKNIREGRTEREVAWEMEKFMKELGAEKNAWDPFIVASGSNSSKIHYRASDKKLKKNDQVLLDWGCFFNGYASDISRVVFLGTPNQKQTEVYDLVLKAQKKGIEQIKVFEPTRKVDFAARSFLADKTKFSFGHAVGHGVGLEVHELPFVNAKTKDKFRVGNVITVEPGIYEPGWGGVRIEDMFLVTKDGPIALTKSVKELDKVIIG